MKINVSHIAKLANLPLDDDEIEKFAPQLESTLKYIEQLNEIDTTNVEPTSQVTRLENVMRDDEVKESLTMEQVLSNSTIKHNNLFMVKGILDND
jgi:aspartyl-tRNA(Asn)/glutamyl-tRNA(Gln) amidotransferase subunit C